MLVPSKSSEDLRAEYEAEFPDETTYDESISGIYDDAGAGTTGASPDPAAPPEVPGAVDQPSTAYDKCIMVMQFFQKINLAAQEMAYYINGYQNKMNKFGILAAIGAFG